MLNNIMLNNWYKIS